MEIPNCPICLASETKSRIMCPDRSHVPACEDCISQYIAFKIKSDYNGHCSTIYCPCIHENKYIRPIINYRTWSTIALLPSNILDLHKQHASSLLSFLCGGCHIMRSLALINATKAERDLARDKVENLLKQTSKISEFYEQLSFFEIGMISIEEFFVIINSSFSFHSYSNSEDKFVWDCFKCILLLIVDPERQCGLHLRFLRSRPRIWTTCCNKEHCFRCRTKDFHVGRTCAENTELLDSSVIECPSCRISVVKGDGCNTVTCVCGQMFSWAAEMDNMERSRRFQAEFPMNTHNACVEVLCVETLGQISDARAWRTKNKVEVDCALMTWWKIKYSPFPSQVCALSPQNLPNRAMSIISEGESEARLLWELHHSEETTRCKASNHISRQSLFTTLYPREEDRPPAAVSLLQISYKHNSHLWGASIEKNLVASAEMWKSQNIDLYEKELENREAKYSYQFIHLYGSSSPTVNQLLSGQVISPIEWNRSISNTALTFTNEDLTVERVGGVSSYPAAFASLPAPCCKFTVVIDKCQRGPNWLTFGLAKRGMATSSSDGVGRTRDSWGLCDDRSSAAGRCRVCACGTEVASCRKFQLGDVLSAYVDVLEFNIPAGNCDTYVFAMTFANDHSVSIIPNIATMNAIFENELNEDHVRMLHALRRRLKRINAGQTSLPKAILEELSSKWENSFKDPKDAGQALEAAKPFIQLLLGMPGDIKQFSIDNNFPTCQLSWNCLVHAICWERINRERLEKEKKEKLAMKFVSDFGESAPFLAAAGLCDFSGPLSKLFEPIMIVKEEAAAYMECFPQEMNAWYDYNASLAEPMFGLERVPKQCRCLPRHVCTCPNQNIDK